MAPRRRLPHPSASATSSTLQTGTAGQLPQPGFTFSQFLGMFEEEPPALSGGFLPPGVSYTGESYAFDTHGSGPSRAHSGSYRGQYVVESGWSKDVFGKDLYVGHGRIEEVDDEAASNANRGGDEEDNLAAPRDRAGASVSSLPRSHESNAFHSEEYPLISTPPPCPRPKNLPSLRETSSISDIRAFQPFSVATLPMTRPPPTTTNATSLFVLDERSEINILRENLNLLGSSLEDVKFMNTVRPLLPFHFIHSKCVLLFLSIFSPIASSTTFLTTSIFAHDLRSL